MSKDEGVYALTKLIEILNQIKELEDRGIIRVNKVIILQANRTIIATKRELNKK